MMIGDKIKKVSPSETLGIKSMKINWHLTPWCNYNCPYCCLSGAHTNDPTFKISQEDAEKQAAVIASAIKSKDSKITICGGEISYLDVAKICNVFLESNDNISKLTYISNFSGSIEHYMDYLRVSNRVSCVSLLTSYLWVNLEKFISKQLELRLCMSKENLGTCYLESSCVVWHKTTLELVQKVAKAFVDNNIRLRFTLCRIPNANGAIDEITPEVVEFCKKHNDDFYDLSLLFVEYCDGTKATFSTKMDFANYVKQELGTDYPDLSGMYCVSCPTIENGKIKAASCVSKRNIIIGNLTNDGIIAPDGKKINTLFPHTSVCDTKGHGCNLCNIMYLWNGQF